MSRDRNELLIPVELAALDPTTDLPNRVPVFHGYSASGGAEAEYVYVGRGQQVDFERLGR